ncbi:hypothetical protein [Enterococcus sp. AZ109]|uniref:hypothetical protein n=1 Tax=Enterococcus sp. AZ109 TaxID=2774634 RepID=UPI003F1F60A7
MKKLISVGILLSSCLILGACGGDDTGTGDSNGQANISNTNQVNTQEEDNSLLSNHENFKKLAVNNGATDAKVLDEKTYNVEWSDNTWSGVTISANEVTILKLSDYSDYSDNQYEGFIIVHFNIDNAERDTSLYPEQATLVTNTGEQTEGKYDLDHFGGDLLQGSKVNGYAAYPLNTLESVDSINQIRMKFNGTYMTDDYLDENSNHEYDITIDLQ